MRVDKVLRVQAQDTAVCRDWGSRPGLCTRHRGCCAAIRTVCVCGCLHAGTAELHVRLCGRRAWEPADGAVDRARRLGGRYPSRERFRGTAPGPSPGDTLLLQDPSARRSPRSSMTGCRASTRLSVWARRPSRDSGRVPPPSTRARTPSVPASLTASNRTALSSHRSRRCRDRPRGELRKRADFSADGLLERDTPVRSTRRRGVHLQQHEQPTGRRLPHARTAGSCPETGARQSRIAHREDPQADADDARQAAALGLDHRASGEPAWDGDDGPLPGRWAVACDRIQEARGCAARSRASDRKSSRKSHVASPSDLKRQAQAQAREKGSRGAGDDLPRVDWNAQLE